MKVHQCSKRKIFEFEVKNGKFSVSVREEKCNVIARVYVQWNAVARTSRVVHVLITSVYLSLRTFSFFFSFFFFLLLFSVFPLCIFCPCFAFSSAKSCEKYNSSLSCCTLRLFYASVTWKTWKTHSVRLRVSYEIDVTLIETPKCSNASAAFRTYAHGKNEKHNR